MHSLLRLALGLAVGLVSAFAQVRNVGPIVFDYNSKSLAVRVSASTPELNTLALAAFNVHGRYRLVTSDFLYDIKFAQVSATQLRVDITRGAVGTPVASETVTGNNLHQALFRAADVAVEKTNGLGLRGFFTARLAFIGERTGRKEVYVSDLFLTDAKQITRDNAAVLTPRWAPDGARLLYTSFYKSGFPDIFSHDLATNARTTFVSFRGLNSGARYSPNGLQVAMILTGEGTPDIYVSNAQGRQVSRKTRSEAVKASPCWSPDGTRLVFTMEPGPQLYTMSAAGGSPTRLVTGFTYVAEPDWSRASPNKIACTVRVAGGRYQIAVYDFSQGKAAVVSAAPFDGQVPSWLADGRHLVFTARDKSTSALFVLDTETGKSTRISPVNFVAMEASVWTP